MTRITELSEMDIQTVIVIVFHMFKEKSGDINKDPNQTSED